MSRQRQHTSSAERQRAYRVRKRNGLSAQNGDNSVTFDTLFRAVEATTTDGSNERYTPQWVIDSARRVLGGIDLDPASNAAAQTRVRAHHYYTQADNGLVQPWAGRVWCNPPYDNPLPWVQKMIGHYRAGDITAALMLLNADSSTRWAFPLLQGGYPVCFFSTRIAFVYPDGKPRKGNDRPQWIWYLGKHRRRFAAEFGQYGAIR